MAKLPAIGKEVLVHLKSGVVAPAIVLKYNDHDTTIAVRLKGSDTIITSLSDTVQAPAQPYFSLPNQSRKAEELNAGTVQVRAEEESDAERERRLAGREKK